MNNPNTYFIFDSVWFDKLTPADIIPISFIVIIYFPLSLTLIQ